MLMGFNKALLLFGGILLGGYAMWNHIESVEK